MDPAAIWPLLAARFAVLGASLPADGWFADDGDLDYGTRPGAVLARRSLLMPFSETRSWAGYFDPGHSWVHCSLLRSADGVTVVAARTGGTSRHPGKPTPLNVSVERAMLIIQDD